MILYGASGHGKVVIDILEALNIKLDFVVDDNPCLTDLLGYEVKRNTGHYDEAIVTIGANEIRKRITELVQVSRYLTAIHPSAIVSPKAFIHEGTVVMQGAIIQSCATIGKHCIINTGSTVDHECNISDFVHISPQATLSGNVTVGEGTWIGAGAVVKQGVTIGSWSVIGAGSVVVDDIPSDVVAFGNKCKVIKRRKDI